MLAQLTRFYPHLVRDELQVYFRDVQDHVARVAEATDTMREMLTAAMSVRRIIGLVGDSRNTMRVEG